MRIPDIALALDLETEKRIKAYPHPNNRASEAGHPCERFLVLSRLNGDKKALHGLGLQRIFDEGNLHEGAVLREIQDAGFMLTEQQRPYEWKKFDLTGRIDAKIALNGHSYPLEIKSSSANVFLAVKDIAPEDMLKSKHSWIRKYPAQILLYCLMQGAEFGVMIFKNKQTGEKCQKVFRLSDENLEYAEAILKKLERVNVAVAKGEAPPAAPCPDCRDCGFAKTVCFPDQDYGPGFEILTDADLEAKLNRLEETAPASKEHDELDKELKEYFKGKSAIVGKWKIESRAYEMTSYNIPKDVKAQYVEKKTTYRTTIDRLGGSDETTETA